MLTFESVVLHCYTPCCTLVCSLSVYTCRCIPRNFAIGLDVKVCLITGVLVIANSGLSSTDVHGLIYECR